MLQSRATNEEFGALAHEDTYKEPEHRLMLAVLEEALMTFERGLNSPVARQRKDFVQVVAWVRSDDHDWPFSFESICSTLEIDADYLRNKLAALRRKAFVSRTFTKKRKLRRAMICDRHVWKGQIR